MITVRVGCRLRAPGPEKFICEGSFGSRKCSPVDSKFGTLMEVNERNSMVHAFG